MSLDLRPSLLDDLGLMAAIRWYLERHQRRLGGSATLVGDLADLRLPAPLETACFRVAQEALTNVARHAGARSVCVEVRRSGGGIELIVRDDGAGFDVDAARRRAVAGHEHGSPRHGGTPDARRRPSRDRVASRRRHRGPRLAAAHCRRITRRPKTASWVGEDARMRSMVARATGVPRPAKPARQTSTRTLRDVRATKDSPRIRRSCAGADPTRSAPGRTVLAAPALPAAARRSRVPPASHARTPTPTQDVVLGRLRGSVAGTRARAARRRPRRLGR